MRTRDEALDVPSDGFREADHYGRTIQRLSRPSRAERGVMQSYIVRARHLRRAFPSLPIRAASQLVRSRGTDKTDEELVAWVVSASSDDLEEIRNFGPKMVTAVLAARSDALAAKGGPTVADVASGAAIGAEEYAGAVAYQSENRSDVSRYWLRTSGGKRYRLTVEETDEA